MMKPILQIFDFCLSLADKMLQSGASLERVNDTVSRICYSYHVHGFSLYSLNNLMILTGHLKGEEPITSQRTMQPAGIHLQKLARCNQLSRKVCMSKPDAAELKMMLSSIDEVKEYPPLLVMGGQLLAMGCLARIFGGNLADVLCAVVISAIMYVLGLLIKRPWLNGVVFNSLSACLAGVLGMLCVRWGLGRDIYTLMITCSFMLLPGIPFVKAASNLLCGNEMNAIMEFLKVLVDTVAITGGFVAAIYFFGGLIVW